MMNSPCETLIMLMPANCFCQLSRNPSTINMHLLLQKVMPDARISRPKLSICAKNSDLRYLSSLI